MHLWKESLKKIQAWTEFEPMTSATTSWEHVILLIRNVPVDGSEIYEYRYIYTADENNK